MTKRTEALPAPDDDASPATCETGKAPATASDGEGKGGLPTISAAGRSEWNTALAVQVMQAVTGGLDPGEPDEGGHLGRRLRAGLAAMQGIEPGDVLEDMAAAQLVAAHHAAMQAYGRAANPDQPFAVWRESLNQANRLSRTFAAMLEALNRHRGKGGQQRVVVEHVTVKRGRAGGRRRGRATRGEGGQWLKSRRSMPCTRRPVVARRRGAELPVSHPRWPTDDAGCTAGSCPGRRAETATPGSMATTAQRRSGSARKPMR